MLFLILQFILQLIMIASFCFYLICCVYGQEIIIKNVEKQMEELKEEQKCYF